jgi:Leucine-rich repeat (LRR) protein
MVALKHLNVAKNEITELPEEMSCLTELETLDISSNLIVGVPSCLLRCKSLQVLFLSDENAVAQMAELVASFPDLHTVEARKD